MNRTLAMMALLLAAGLSACGREPGGVVTREGQPSVIRVDEEDGEMNAAMRKARDTLGEFVQAIDNPGPDSHLSLKVRFEESGSVEHIWLSEVSHYGEQFFGNVANEPFALDEIRLGQRVTVRRDQVSDWMIVDRGQVRGGFTVELLRSRMSVDERQAFDAETGGAMSAPTPLPDT